MSYSTKFASSFYGPFREAAGTALKGDRKTYQMSPMNRREAIRESLLDEARGADCLMVKPAGAYLDILRDIRERTDLPLGAYQVSGEYAMIKFAAQAGAIDEEKVVLESLGAIKRAGADPDLQLFRHRSGREKNPALNLSLSPVALALTGATNQMPDRSPDKALAAIRGSSPVALTLTGATNQTPNRSRDEA